MPNDELNRQNTQTVFMQIRDIDNRVREQTVMLKQLVTTIGMIEARLRETEAALAAARIGYLGAGPTVKPNG